ncbi:MAG: (2Fe-2S)-binding protein [Ignavibacteria bacterium]|nr:(2Fe-2S)-binding protein [Ignavibacteria bacterium]MBT8387684.1 (2Fe-2S)-binding protein [Ignavibacteria bacterium]
MSKISFTLNGKHVTVDCNPGTRLLDLIREELELTGTKEGCSIGECGACTVIFNGEAVNSCLLLAGQINNSVIITVEGLVENGGLSKLQKMFLEKGAVQCGFCTPGVLMSAYALLLENENPTVEDIKIALSGNLCRCTGYKQMIDAVKSSAPL